MNDYVPRTQGGTNSNTASQAPNAIAANKYDDKFGSELTYWNSFFKYYTGLAKKTA